MKITSWIVLIIVGAVLLAVSLRGKEKKPTIEVRKIIPEDNTVLEEWQRVTNEPDILGVEAAKMNGSKWKWQVFINAAEFVRKERWQGVWRKTLPPL
jgi:hypothetical protein